MMKKSNVPLNPQASLFTFREGLILVIIAFILFIIFRGPLSTFYFAAASFGLLFLYYYNTCIAFHIKSRTNSLISPEDFVFAFALSSFIL